MEIIDIKKKMLCRKETKMKRLIRKYIENLARFYPTGIIPVK